MSTKNEIDKYFNFTINNGLEFSEKEYKYLFNRDHEHFKKNYIKSAGVSNYQNYLYKIPRDLDLEFMFSYYKVGDEITARKNFIRKYLNQKYILHFPFSLKKYNLGFIYSLYMHKKIYNLNLIYSFINSTENNVKYFNSRQLIWRKEKSRKPILFVYYLKTGRAPEIYCEGINKIKGHKNFCDIVFVLKEKEHNENPMKLDQTIYVSKKTKLPEIYKIGISYFQKKYKDTFSEFTICLCSKNIFINKSLDPIFDFYFSIDNKIVSLCDRYNSKNEKYFYSFCLDFVIVDSAHSTEFIKSGKKDFCLTYVKKVIKNNTFERYLPIGYISIDDFLPLFNRDYQNINLLRKPFLLNRKDSPIYHVKDYKFLKAIHGPKNLCDSELNSLFSSCKSNLKSISETSDLTFAPEQSTEIITDQNIKTSEKSSTIESEKSNVEIKVESGITAVIAHMGKVHDEFLFEIKELIKQVPMFNFHLYITVIDEIYRKVKKQIYVYFDEYIQNIYIIPLENIGADLFPFIYVVENYILNSDYEYLNILKYHTKTDNVWRKELLEPLSKNYNLSCELLQRYDKIGVVSSGEFILDFDFVTQGIFSEFCERLKINKADFPDCKFVGGTIFLIKCELVKKFFSDYKISVESEKQFFKTNYSQHYKHSEILYVHLWERVLSGIIPHLYSRHIIGL